MKSTIWRNNGKPEPLSTMPSLAITPTSIRPALFVSFLLIPSFHCFLSKKENVIWNKMQKYEKVSSEKNREAAMALISEIRRVKARLMEAVPKLQKSAKNKVKGLSKGDLQTRFDLVLASIERIKAIRDGSTLAENHNGGCGTSSSNKNNKFDSLEKCSHSGFFRRIKELEQFRQDYEMREKKQASKVVSDIAVHYHLNVYNMCMQQGLDVISEGLDMLKNIVLDMNEAIDRQVPLMDEIDSKVDQTTFDIRNNNAKLEQNITQEIDRQVPPMDEIDPKVDQTTSDIRNNNVTLKQTITQIRSDRNFSVDIILLCVILGIAFYLNNTVK